jgi:hypothetical protein
MTRTDTLLSLLAAGFGEGTNLLASTDWLSRHHVSLEECLDLSSLIGSVLHGYVLAPQEIRTALRVSGALAPERGLEHAIWHTAFMTRAIRELQDTKDGH